MLYTIMAVIGVVVFIVSSTVRILKEYERGVVYRLGRVIGLKGPGICFLIPVVDKMKVISTRIVTLDIEPQDVISRDNISLKVNAVVYLRVVDPIKADVNIQNYMYATSQLAQTSLRSLMGEHTLDQILTEREQINDKIQVTLDENTDPWGIKVISVELKHVDLPVDMQRAMAKEAEAERERRGKIIAAEGEAQAAEKLLAAAEELSQNPMTLHLRYLQTLSDVAVENSSTILFPIPMDMIKGFMKKFDLSDK